MNKVLPYTITLTLILFSSIFYYEPVFSQDTTSLKPKNDTTAYKPEILLSHSKYFCINSVQPDTITRSRFLWLPLKLFDNIFDYLPGYYLNYMDVGQPNFISYEQLDHHYTGLLRNGIPLNDLFDGSIDLSQLSRNEVAEVEMTNGYGNSLYNFDNFVNVIQRQVYQYRPYSEISYWQDRFNNLYFDGTYHQNIFKNFNFNFGITKHSYDGVYTNSDFDKWQGRFNLSYFGSKHVNLLFSTNYLRIHRGLNEGIDPFTTVFDPSNLLGSGIADVLKPNARDDIERFGAIFDILLAYGKNKDSYTDLKLFTDNSFRRYSDQDTNQVIAENTHWIDYGLKLKQNIAFEPTKKIKMVSSTEFEYDRDYVYSPLNELRNSDRVYLYEGIDIITGPFGANAFAKAYRYGYFENKFFYDYGLKPSFEMKIIPDIQFDAFARLTSSHKLPTYEQEFLKEKYPAENMYPSMGYEELTHTGLGGTIQYKDNKLSVEYYHNTIKNMIALCIQNGLYRIDNKSEGSNYGTNTNLNVTLFHFELDANVNYNTNPYGGLTTIPDWDGNISLAYHNLLVHDKLELKVGVNTRFWDKHYAEFYNGRYNDFNNRFIDTTQINYDSYIIKSNATLDFFVIGKIDKAVFGLTFENFLDRIIYTTGVYPFQGRGGLGNVLSRFNVTWYFLN